MRRHYFLHPLELISATDVRTQFQNGKRKNVLSKVDRWLERNNESPKKEQQIVLLSIKIDNIDRYHTNQSANQWWHAFIFHIFYKCTRNHSLWNCVTTKLIEKNLYRMGEEGEKILCSVFFFYYYFHLPFFFFQLYGKNAIEMWTTANTNHIGCRL